MKGGFNFRVSYLFSVLLTTNPNPLFLSPHQKGRGKQIQADATNDFGI